MNITTRVITGSPLVIEKGEGFPVYKISILAQGGSVGITGNFPYLGVASQQITLADGQALTIEAGASRGIDGLTIDPLAATAAVIMFF